MNILVVDDDRWHLKLARQVPTADGLALVRRLKSDPATRLAPVVAIASYPERCPRAAALAAGRGEYRAEPMSARNLPGQLEEFARQAAWSGE